MLLCDKCNRGVHIYCSCYTLPDNFNVEEDLWLCQFCHQGELYTTENDTGTSKDQVEFDAVPSDQLPPNDTLLDVRCLPPNYELEFFSRDKSCFVPETLIPQHVKQKFYTSMCMRRSISRLRLNGTPVFPEDTTIKSTNGDYTIRKWRFMNGTYIGIKQILNYLQKIVHRRLAYVQRTSPNMGRRQCYAHP